ncbi:hypothetical protein Tco_0920398, partial [Tanacetum coccineum]
TDISKYHKKPVKNKQARTREQKSEQKPEAKPGKVKPSVKVVKSWDSSVKSRAIIGLLKHRAHAAMNETQRGVGFALNTLTQLAQAVTSKNDSLAIRVINTHSHRTVFLLDKTGSPHGANRYGDLTTGDAPGIRSMRNSISRPSIEGSKVQKKEKAYEDEKYSAACRYMLSITCDDEDDFIPLGDIIARYSTSKAITPDLPIKEPEDSLIMEDEHLDIIPEIESDEFIKSSVENLVQNPSESTDLSDGKSDDDESLSEEEIQKDEFKYFSNPLYDLDDEIITNEEILPNQKDLDVVIPIPPGTDKRCFNAESDLLESLLNRDSPIDSTKIDSIFDESLSPLYPVEDSDPFMEEIDIFLASDDSTPPGVESDYDSEGDILLLEELLNDDFVPLAEYNHFTFDVEPDTSVKNDFDELNEDECFDSGGGENVVFLNVEEDDSFTFTIRTFLPFVTYPEVSPLLSSTKNEDTIFDPGIST